MDFLTLQAAKNYTNETAEGMGIQKGKNCQIQSIEDITGGHRITFAWYDEDQVLQTDTVDIMDGPEGPEGPQGPQGEVGESGVGFGPVPEVMPEGVNWWIDPNGEPNTAATINDANISEDETWSSKKIDSKFGSNNIWDGVEEAGIINTSTGKDEESTNGRRMPHDKGITVVPGDTYYIKKTTTAKIRYTFYGADGTYIGNEDALGNTLIDTNVMSQKMIPPAGATQFRAFASSSMVSAGLSVSAGVSADIDEINGEIDQVLGQLSALTPQVQSVAAQAAQSASDIIWIVTLNRTDLTPNSEVVASGTITLLKCVRECQIIGNNVVLRTTGDGIVLANGAPSVVIGKPGALCYGNTCNETKEIVADGTNVFIESGSVKLNCSNASKPINFSISYETVD